MINIYQFITILEESAQYRFSSAEADYHELLLRHDGHFLIVNESFRFFWKGLNNEVLTDFLEFASIFNPLLKYFEIENDTMQIWLKRHPTNQATAA